MNWLEILALVLLVWVAALAALAVVAWLMLRRAGNEAQELRRRIARLPWRDKLRLANHLMRSRDVPRWLRAIPPIIVVYLASPLDLIPDFIPVLGQLDDILVLALGVGLLLRFVPADVLRRAVDAIESRAAANQSDRTL